MTEIFQLPQGKINIDFCDENLSAGSLELNSNQALEKHNRPVDEELMQIHGSCVMKIFNDEKIEKEIVLNEGEKLVIPANQYHIYSNPFNTKSTTSWKFEGNIVDVIKNIRDSFSRIL